jgi:hypothetical protein
VTHSRSVVFSGYSSILQQQNWAQRYNRNIVESDVKHHNTLKKENEISLKKCFSIRSSHEYICPLCVLTASGLLMNISVPCVYLQHQVFSWIYPFPLCTYSIRFSHEYICPLCVLTASGLLMNISVPSVYLQHQVSSFTQGTDIFMRRPDAVSTQRVQIY